MQHQPIKLNTLKLNGHLRISKSNDHLLKRTKTQQASQSFRISLLKSPTTCKLTNSAVITFCVETKGESLIHEILSLRNWMVEVLNPSKALVRWKATSINIEFNNYQLINHYSHHRELTTKANLYKNITSYRQQQMNILIHLPKTYVIQKMDELQLFLRCFKMGDIYIFKPTNLNRGQGIKLFNSLSQLRTLSMNHREYVIQEYINNPYLIDGRKFDFRIWALLDQKRRVFWYKQGYLRLSSEKYDKNNIDNLFIHLTNWAVQKHHKRFGTRESGNQMSFNQFQKLECMFYSKVVPKFKQLIQHCFQACYSKMDPYKWKGSYELFGFDFMIDDKLNVFLIEANTNPCIDRSSKLLKQLIPRMLNNMFQIVLDDHYGMPSINYFPLEDSNMDDNLWEQLCQF